MKEEGLSAYIITGGDPHMSEYVAPRWRTRAYFSGFTGSAGLMVVTLTKAGLWTDFRYWIQAAKELDGSGIELFKVGMAGTIPFIDWIASELKEGEKAGVEGSTLAAKTAGEWGERLMGRGISLADAGPLPSALWEDRPSAPATELYSLPLSLAGVDRKEKIERVRELLSLQDCLGTFISSLDDIAWLLNIRAMDVKMNPVALAFCWIDEKRTVLFTDRSRIRKETGEELSRDGIDVRDYQTYADFLRTLPVGKIFLSQEKNSWDIERSLSLETERVGGVDLTTLMKARKNSVEIDCFHKAMIQDGAAMVNFICWLKKAVSEESMDERDVAVKLREFRAAQPGFIEESFSPISAYGANGALCHYDPEGGTPAALLPGSLYLIDSGGQYEGATTDITRTVSLGEPSFDEIRDYTLVLKGHIALSRAQFPEGTRGYQLDILARQPLWNSLMDFGHGTGHGVGAFLNVHEGPHSISTKPIDMPLQEGMVTSNEPGLYREGRYGIRIENLILTVRGGESEFGSFLSFETLTLCPYDRDLIDRNMLSGDEISWINDYHKRVFTLLSGLVDGEAENWLRLACDPI